MKAVEIPVQFWIVRDTFLPAAEMVLKGAWLYDWDDETIAAQYWNGTSDCMYALGNFTWITAPMWLKYVTAHNPGPWLKFSTSLEALSFLADNLQVCNDMGKSSYGFLTNQAAMFEYSFANYLYGFLQNVIAKVISINNVYKSTTFAVA